MFTKRAINKKNLRKELVIQRKKPPLCRKYIDKGDDPMNKVSLLKNLHNASRGNMFSTEIPKATKEDEKRIEELVGELVSEGKIRLRECVQREYSVYLHGIIKYSSE
jgi:hypothetical protein